MTYANLKEQADELQRQAKELQRQADAALAQANAIKNKCKHTWMAEQYDPIVKEGYTVPGDPPGTMGVDHRSAFYVEGTTTPRWSRICFHCGLVQTTTKIKMVVGSQHLKHEEPDFEYTDRYGA